MKFKFISLFVLIGLIFPFGLHRNNKENRIIDSTKERVKSKNEYNKDIPMVNFDTDGSNILNPTYVDFDKTSGDILFNCLITNYHSGYITFSYRFLENPFLSNANLKFSFGIFYKSLDVYKSFFPMTSIIDSQLNSVSDVEGFKTIANFDSTKNILGISFSYPFRISIMFANIKLNSYINNGLIDASIYSGKFNGIIPYEKEGDENEIKKGKSFIFNKNKLSINYGEDLYKKNEPYKLFANMYFYDDNKYHRLKINEDSFFIFIRKLFNPVVNEIYELKASYVCEDENYICTLNVSFFDNYPLVIEVNNLVNANTLVFSYKKALTEEDLIKEILLNVNVYKKDINKTYTPNITIEYFVPYKTGFFLFLFLQLMEIMKVVGMGF